MHHPISYFQAIILGLTQGIAEPFPISSLGHAVVLPQLFGWNIHQNDKFFLTFLVATHFATALTLLLFFLRDWMKIVGGILRSLRVRKIAEDDVYARLGWLLIVGTVPAGILGLALQESLRKLFASATIAAAFLIVNGIALLIFERLRKRPPKPDDYLGDGDGYARIAKLSWRQAIAIGTSQAAALIPGISRSGFAMGGGLLAGLSNEDAARYSLPARHPRDPRRRRAEAARTAGRAGRRRARPGPRRWPLRGADHVPRGEVPAALLRDQPAESVRDLLHRLRRGLHGRVRGLSVL